MANRLGLSVLAVALLIVGATLQCLAQPPAANAPDAVLLNGEIYTMNASAPKAQAVAFREGKIVYVGTTDGARSLIGNGTKVVDLQGKMVLPGFHDSHVHLIDGGVELGQCNLAPCESLSECIDAIKREAAKQPSGWIRGGGWSLTLFANANPTKEILDAIAPDRPVYLESQDHHSAWVNSTALKLAGITVSTAAPAGGRIERNAAGEPSGTLRESAMELVSKVLPPLTPDDYLAGLERAQQKALEFGITSIYDAACDNKLLTAYNTLAKKNRLHLKVTGAMRCDPARDETQVLDFVQSREKFNTKNLKVDAAKIFADGVIEAKTAALLKPYEKSTSSGHLNFDAQRLSGLTRELSQHNFQIHVHAIGDRAIKTTLNAFEEIAALTAQKDLRNHIAHLELIDKDDLPRFKALKTGATVQAYWAQKDKYISELSEPILGKERSQRLYPLRSLRDNGATIIGGSDWPVTTLNPLDAIEVAITRRAPGDTKTPTWLPDQQVGLDTMLNAYTINGAWVAHQDNRTGSIEVGKSADLIVLERDLYRIAPETIHSTSVLMTYTDGELVFERK
jgi:predicted amidohydrolase YtcJ